MKRIGLKHGISAIAIAATIFAINGCTPEQEAFAAGAAVGGVAGAAMASYDYPHYYDRPYYYYNGHYYYGGYYRNGCYYYRNRCYRGGHYYHNGYRYSNGRRYRAVPGRYGYYRSAHEYRHYTARPTHYGTYRHY